MLFRARDRVLWAGTNHGLYRFDGHQFVCSLQSMYISRIEQALDGKLMLVTGRGFVEYDGSETEEHRGVGANFGVSDDKIFNVFQDAQGTIWYCTNKGVRPIGVHAPARLCPGKPANTATFRTFVDSHDVLWLCTGIGVYRVFGNRMQTPAPGLSANTFYASEDGGLWIGTNGRGLTHLQPRLVRMYTSANGLPKNEIAMAVLRAHDGRLWIGNNCGLAVSDGNRFKTFDERDGLANSCVWALAEDSKHDLWIGTYGGGLFRYNGVFTQFTKEQGLASRIVFQITVARDGSLWIATPDGLSHMKGNHVRNYTISDGLSSNRILDIHEDRAGTIWVATQGGVNWYSGNRFLRVQAAAGDVLARRIVEDSGGNLYTTDAPRGISRIIGTRLVLLDNALNLMNMAESSGGNLWFSSREGVIRIAAQDLSRLRTTSDRPLNYEQFDRADGLNSTEASVGSPNITITPEGKVWVGTVKGLAMIDTTQLPAIRRTPKVFISQAMTDGVRSRVGNELTLQPGPHHVELRLAAVDLSAAQKIRLQYFLDGVDSNWLDLNSSRTAVYTNLPAGTHRLHVRATDSRGHGVRRKRSTK